MDFQDVINNIAKELPDLYRMIIDAENGYAEIRLESPDGDEYRCSESHELSLMNQVEMLITLAKDLSENGDTDCDNFTINNL